MAMRLTVREVQEQGLIGKVEVYVDGEKIHRCIEADEEAGYVVCYLGSGDHIILGPDDMPVPMCVVGKVEIKIRD